MAADPVPSSSGRARRVLGEAVRAALLPFVILGRVARDPTARRQLLFVVGVQLALTLGLAFLLAGGTHHLVDTVRARGGTVTITGAFTWLSLWWAHLALAQWLVGWLFLEHNDALWDTGARVVGVPVAGPAPAPRVRLHFRWVWRRIVRRFIVAVVIASAFPFLFAAGALPRVGHVAYSAVLAAWGAYWVAVGVAGASNLVDAAPDGWQPWFLRLWHWLVDRVFLLRWLGGRAYGRAWHRLTRRVHGHARALEETPVPLAALVPVRLLATLPLVSLVVRPYVGVAAGLVLTARRAPSETAATDTRAAV